MNSLLLLSQATTDNPSAEAPAPATTTFTETPPDPGPPPEQASPFNLTFFLAMIMMVIAFYVLIQRPDKKQREQIEKAKESMKKGDSVVSIGGIHGTVVRFNKEKETVIIQVSKGVELEFNRAAVNPYVEPKKPEEDEKDKQKKDSDGKKS